MGILNPKAISLVIWSPANGIEQLCCNAPFLKIAMSVVPAPKSIKQIPSFFHLHKDLMLLMRGKKPLYFQLLIHTFLNT